MIDSLHGPLSSERTEDAGGGTHVQRAKGLETIDLQRCYRQLFASPAYFFESAPRSHRLLPQDTPVLSESQVMLESEHISKEQPCQDNERQHGEQVFIR
jgi:hypothetical protein